MYGDRVTISRWGFSLAVLALAALVFSSGVASQGLQTIKRSSSAMATTADGDTLLVVNPDSGSLTLVDTASR
ncbi:MAG: hypothetical protein JSV36_18300, partial [Anaerolineae bacterium]